ncbi:type II secretion system F family protein [Arthrobacter sp. Cr_A7]|uniref:type II secretion system F family protein n=1 Tax=Arthrobacter sp. Cr_A7 TaxID=3031017 RepID=UPI0023DB6AD9|nr:type II secretion system F family protein [Arthrobacter sp. Cr_A7]MDF2052505.1 type II secretion system F family protein [Arthrobacter sp. Cr_A7]
MTIDVTSTTAMVLGLALVYLALIMGLWALLRSGTSLSLERRRLGAVQQPTNLTKLTAATLSVIEARLSPRSNGVLSRRRLDSAGLKKQPADYLLSSGITCVVAGAFGFVLGGVSLAALLIIAAAIGLVITLKLLTSRRRAKFDEQVPDTLRMLSGGMRAGHSLLRSLDAAAQESEAPMADELSRVVNETRIGRDLGDSLLDVAERTDNEDFGWIAQAIEIHREVGGDLAEVLDHVGETIRDRNQIRRQVKALSAEGRVSALVLISLPIILFIALQFVNPHYAKTFSSTVPGYLMMGAAAVMLSLGAFWLSRLIKPKY